MRYAIAAVLLVLATGCSTVSTGRSTVSTGRSTVSTINIDRQFHACLKADRAPSYVLDGDRLTMECR